MNRKVISYLGFAKKSGNLLTGVNTCSFAMAKGKVKLMILAEDISENSREKNHEGNPKVRRKSYRIR